MTTIDRVADLVMFGALAVLVLFFVFWAVRAYRQKNGMVKTKTTDENEKYESFRVLDSATYIPINDVKNGMLIQNNGRRFTASINTQGFDFYQESPSRQEGVMNGYRSLILSMDEPFTLRLDSRACDLSVQIAKHEECKNAEEELLEMLLSERGRYLASVVRKEDGSIDEKARAEIEKLDEMIAYKNWQIDHLANLIHEMQGYADGNVVTRSARYMVSWVFHERDFPHEFSYDERVEFAEKTLADKTTTIANGLSMVGVKSKRDTSADLYELIYRHNHPTANNLSRDAILAASGFSQDDLLIEGE